METDESLRCPPSYSQAVVHRIQAPTAQRTISGSETDISTSTENLTREEKYVLSHTERQEPQGEENFINPSPVGGLDLSAPPAAMEWAKSVDGFKCPAPVAPLPPASRPPPQYQLPAAVPAAVETAGDVFQRRGVLLHDSDSALPSLPSVKLVAPTIPHSIVVSSASADQLSVLSVNSQPESAASAGYVAANANEMVQILMQENSHLKQEVVVYQRKVQKLQKFALELSKLQSAYDDLVKTCQRREQLEYLARQKLVAEARRAAELNSSLSCQLDSSSSTGAAAADSDRHQLVTQLAAQNRELQSIRERQEIELSAQRSTLQEQRQYIDILDTALSKAQEKAALIERHNAERIRSQYVERSTYVERVAQLQRSLTSYQLAAERREAAQKKIRATLERELVELRSSRQLLPQETAEPGGSGDDIQSRETQVATLRQQLRGAHERILLMENELAHAQQKFVESGSESEAAMLLNASLANFSVSSPPTSSSITAGFSRSVELADSSALVPDAAVQMACHSVSSCPQFSLSTTTTATTPPAVSLATHEQNMEQRMMSLEVQLAEKEAMVRALQRRRALESSVVLQTPHTRQSSAQSLPATTSSFIGSAVSADVASPAVQSFVTPHRTVGGRSLLGESDCVPVNPTLSALHAEYDRLSTNQHLMQSTNQHRVYSVSTNQSSVLSSASANQQLAPSALASQCSSASVSVKRSLPLNVHQNVLPHVLPSHSLPPYVPPTSAFSASSDMHHVPLSASVNSDFPPLTAASMTTSGSTHQNVSSLIGENIIPSSSAPSNISVCPSVRQPVAYSSIGDQQIPLSNHYFSVATTNQPSALHFASANQGAPLSSIANQNAPASNSANQDVPASRAANQNAPAPANQASPQSVSNSIVLALQKDSEVFPDHYWHV